MVEHGVRRGSRRMLAGAAVAALALTGCGSATSGSGGAPTQPGGDVGTRTDIPLPEALARLPLRDQTGRIRTLGTFAGKVLVLSDSMTLCQETCPLDTASLVQAARSVNRAGLGDRVQFVSITVDPVRDTTPQLSAYRKLFAPAPPNWTLLTGTPQQIASLWRTIGVYVHRVAEQDPAHPPRHWRTGARLTYDVEHSDEVFFFDEHQHDRFVLEGPPHLSGKGDVPAALYRFMSRKGHQNVLKPDATAWTVPQALQVIAWLTGRRIPS